MTTFAIITIKSMLVQTTFKVKRLLIIDTLLHRVNEIRQKNQEPRQKTKDQRTKKYINHNSDKSESAIEHNRKSSDTNE